MASITCKELSGGMIDCTDALSGNSADELKKAIMAHGQECHKGILQTMPEDVKSKIMQKVDSLFK